MAEVHEDPYPSKIAMEAAVELEVSAALGVVQTQTIGKVIQRAINKAIADLPDAGIPTMAKTLGDIDRARLQLEWLAKQERPAWGAHIARGEKPNDPLMLAMIGQGLIERSGDGYVVSDFGRKMLAR